LFFWEATYASVAEILIHSIHTRIPQSIILDPPPPFMRRGALTLGATVAADNPLIWFDMALACLTPLAIFAICSADTIVIHYKYILYGGYVLPTQITTNLFP